MIKKEENTNFESAFKRLEEILEKLNSGSVPLDESLALYEEADKLIALCSQKLNYAENKIEQLIKQRNGDLVLGGDGQPSTEPFDPGRAQ